MVLSTSEIKSIFNSVNIIKQFKSAYPDKTAYKSWNEKALLLNKEGFTIQSSSLIENLDIEDCCELLDFLSQ